MRTRAAMACIALLLTTPLAGATVAEAQIKPMSSGQPSFDAPEMRRHGSGFTRPNRPHRHRRRHPLLPTLGARPTYR